MLGRSRKLFLDTCFNKVLGLITVTRLSPDEVRGRSTPDHYVLRDLFTFYFKMNPSKPPMTIAGAACGAVSLVLGVVAIALPKWVVYDAGIAQVGYGLWRACASVSSEGDVFCKSYVQTPGWIIATAAMEVAGICVIVFAVSLAFLHIFIAKNNKVAGKLPGPSAIIGGILMIVGAIIWAVKYKHEPGLAICSLSVGFILAIVSAILSFIAGILLFLGWRAESSGQTYTMF